MKQRSPASRRPGIRRDGSSFDVFISYSSRDAEWVRGSLLPRIEAEGIRVFIDFRDFTRGSPSIREMERGVQDTQKTLVVLTPDYVASEWCELEALITQSLDPTNRSLKLLPILKTDCQKPSSIAILTHIDFTVDADQDLAWLQLIGSLKGDVPKPSAAIPPRVKSKLDAAELLFKQDNFTSAVPILEKAVALADKSGHEESRARTRIKLAQCLFEGFERTADAEKLCRQALEFIPATELSLRHDAIHWLGNMLVVSRDLERAAPTIQHGLSIATVSGSKDDLVASLIAQALLEDAQGLDTQALATLDKAISALREWELSAQGPDVRRHQAHQLGICLMNKAKIKRDCGEPDEALALYDRATEAHEFSGEKLNRGKALVWKGETLWSHANWTEGWRCYQEAIPLFQETGNSLWFARALGDMARFLAQQENWEEALKAMLGAVEGAREAGHAGEHVHFLALASKLVREWKRHAMLDNIGLQIREISKSIPDTQQSEAMTALMPQMERLRAEIESTIRSDSEAGELLQQATSIAVEHDLHEAHANCILAEISDTLTNSDEHRRHELRMQAITLLERALHKAQAPNQRGHLMGRLHALHRELHDRATARKWLERAANLFKETGDVYGLAHVHGSWAELAREEHQTSEAVHHLEASLSVLKGRTFAHLEAGTKINLACELRIQRKYDEALRLLDDAETVADHHGYEDFKAAIGRNRWRIEKELELQQAPTRSFDDLIDSLQQLLVYGPESAPSYLAFWYYAWNTEILRVCRSSPGLSLMVITDDVDQFIGFSSSARGFADYFLMNTSLEPKQDLNPQVLRIPPTWLWPSTFPLLLMKKQEAERFREAEANPKVRLAGPATLLPPYFLTTDAGLAPGEGAVMAMAKTSLPSQALHLMIDRADLLKSQRAMWLPTDRFQCDDPLICDLNIARDRRLFPLYFERPPTSDRVRFLAAVDVCIPHSSAAAWKAAIARLPLLPRAEAVLSLMDIGQAMQSSPNDASPLSCRILLFGWEDADEEAHHPVLVVPQRT